MSTGTIDLTGIASALEEIFSSDAMDFALSQGGCPRRCHFDVRLGYNQHLSAHTLILRHNNRESIEVEMPSVVSTVAQDRASVLERTRPWLRGLHRFHPESGIK